MHRGVSRGETGLLVDSLQSERRAALQLVAENGGGSDRVERAAYVLIQSVETSNRDLALGIWRAAGIEPRKRRRRGRPRKRAA